MTRYVTVGYGDVISLVQNEDTVITIRSDLPSSNVTTTSTSFGGNGGFFWVTTTSFNNLSQRGGYPFGWHAPTEPMSRKKVHHRHLLGAQPVPRDERAPGRPPSQLPPFMLAPASRRSARV